MFSPYLRFARADADVKSSGSSLTGGGGGDKKGKGGEGGGGGEDDEGSEAAEDEAAAEAELFNTKRARDSTTPEVLTDEDKKNDVILNTQKRDAKNVANKSGKDRGSAIEIEIRGVVHLRLMYVYSQITTLSYR